MRNIAYLPGDGIGPEVLAVARNVLEAAGFEAQWVELPVGWTEWRERGEPLPAETVRRMRRCDAGLFGAITSKPDEEARKDLAPRLRGRGLSYRSPLLRIRRELDLWANVRPVRSFPGLGPDGRGPVDLVIFRENTEDLYAGIEAHPFPDALRTAWAEAAAGALPSAGPDTAVSLRVITRQATQRIVRAAFEHAKAHGRRRVTLIEKANVLRATGGLVRAVFHDVARRYRSIKAEELHVDAACARVVRDPQAFDVVVATNLFGDIFSDVAAEAAGGLPMAAACNLGDDFALYEPVHGSAPDIAGRGVANPLGAVLAGAWMARDLDEAGVANRVEGAVNELLSQPRDRPVDLGGRATTAAVERRLQTLVGRKGPPRSRAKAA